MNAPNASGAAAHSQPMKNATSAAAGQVRQFVAEGEAVRFLEHGGEQDHARGRHERAERERRR